MVLQWLIMRLQAKSVERGWEKLMRRVALMPTLLKGRRWTRRDEKCPMVTKTRLTQPVPSYWRGMGQLSDVQLPLLWQLYTNCFTFSIYNFSCASSICHTWLVWYFTKAVLPKGNDLRSCSYSDILQWSNRSVIYNHVAGVCNNYNYCPCTRSYMGRGGVFPSSLQKMNCSSAIHLGRTCGQPILF